MQLRKPLVVKLMLSSIASIRDSIVDDSEDTDCSSAKGADTGVPVGWGGAWMLKPLLCSSVTGLGSWSMAVLVMALMSEH